MAFFSRLRVNSLATNLTRRQFSTILSTKEETRAALSQLKTEENPEKIIEICSSVSLTPEARLDRVVFSEAVSKLAKSNNFSYIQSFIDDLRSSRPDLKYSERFAAHSIILFGQAKMVDAAVKAFKEGEFKTINVLNALLVACYMAKDYEMFKRVYLEFPKMYDIKLDLDSYNTVIKSFCEWGNSSSGFSILAEMDKNWIKPNATTVGNLLAGFYKEDKYAEVGKVLDLMNEKYGIKPNLNVYNIRIHSLCKARRSNEAKALLDGMLKRKMKPNANTFLHLIHGFCNEGNLEEAKKLFNSMKKYPCKPNPDCYFTLLHFLCKERDFETALEICKKSMEQKWVPNMGTMKALVNGLSSIGKVDEAKAIIKEIKETFTKNVHLWDEVEAGLAQ